MFDIKVYYKYTFDYKIIKRNLRMRAHTNNNISLTNKVFRVKPQLS